MAARKVKTLQQVADEMRESQLEQLDEQIADINKRLAKYDPLVELRNQLMSARRAMLGGNRSTGEGGNRLTMEEVVRVVRENPGLSAMDLAKIAGVGRTTIGSHLSRYNGDRFLNKNNKWWLRDPKNGVNTVDDIDEDED